MLNYVGRLTWETSTGVTAVGVVDGGQLCQSGGRLTAVGGGGGAGFAADYVPGVYRVTRVDVTAAGVGCGIGARQALTPSIAAAGGGIVAVAVAPGPGAGYVAGRSTPHHHHPRITVLMT